MGNFLDVRPNTSPIQMMENNQLFQQVFLCRHLDDPNNWLFFS